MTKQINIDIKSRGIASAYVNAPFDEGKQALEEQDYRIISLEENAKLIIQEGKDAYISRNGNWVIEDVVYVPKKGIFLTKNSSVMANAKEATDCHRNRKDFYLTDNQVEEALVDSVELTDKSIPTNEFADNKITIYAFGSEENAKNYGDFLKEVKIDEIPIWLADMQDKSFVIQMWFGSLGGGSVLDGKCWNHGYGNMRGVCNSA